MSKRKPFFEARDTFLVTTTDKELHGGYMALADSERGDLAMLAGYGGSSRRNMSETTYCVNFYQ
ncbi:hypothetical protein CO009_03265 [Candidatus Shapirobacteria bacterium CG_4_8_14_3_um_filter_35_11]|uniref:Uncharacterized protein n=1 Tax=Candidatus Shapirobacteria bacterium CG_4_8_14_3_um_filter_35_11 TaxID=1974874 RepID=A0A2M8GJ50_9BACT|nr:MAG: hypothetical protein CO009_03265 [Candidatus Shapirobacteria bacterium CG_4_8_14_3_um_filter_35_11]